MLLPTPTALFTIACLLATALPALAVEPLNIKRCPALKTKRIGKKTSCNVYGNLADPAPVQDGIMAANAFECAQRCFAAKACKSFGFNPSSQTCDVFKKLLLDQGFAKTPQNQSDGFEYYGKHCYLSTPINYTPIKDGDFSDASSVGDEYWAAGFHNGNKAKRGVYPTEKIHHANDGGYSGYFYQSAADTELTDYIDQDIKTCPGTVYELTYDYGKNAFGALSESVDSTQVDYEPRGSAASAETVRPPSYFKPSESMSFLKFIQKSPVNSDQETVKAEIDNVFIQAVYESSVPADATIVDV